MPPLVGWAAATGNLTLPALFLFLIVFFWTPPHFWALALLIRDNYAAANVPMLPVVRGERETIRQIVVYTLVLIAITLLPFAWGTLGLVYAVSALALGGVFLALTLRLRSKATRPRAALPLPLLAALPRAALRRDGDRRPLTPEEQELARKNNALGWSLFALAVVLALGTVAVALIYNAVSNSRPFRSRYRSTADLSGRENVPRYMIERRFTVGESEMPNIGRRSKEIVVGQFPAIVWEHSHVLVDDDGTAYTYCVYEAPDENTVRAARRGAERVLGEHVLDPGDHRRRLAGRLPARARGAARRARRPRSLIGACAAREPHRVLDVQQRLVGHRALAREVAAALVALRQ